jgi:Ca-activated chloride channel family protein
MGLNTGGNLHEPLTLIYPREGIITADYPLMLLNADKRDSYDKVVAYLLQPDVQRRIMNDTARRPAVPGVPLDSRFPTQVLVELPFPAQFQTVDALLTVYLDQLRRPASAVFVLDVSGSMEGDRLASLESALKSLTGIDQSPAARFAQFHARERVTFITFSSTVEDEQTFTIDDSAPDAPDMQAIRDYADGLVAGGNTAIYDALEEAYTTVETDQTTDPNRLYSIVLMTDGENNAGEGVNSFKFTYESLPDAARAVHVYPILFGNANPDEMQAIAAETGGRVFDATSTDLTTVFRQIRGYQ